MVVPILEEHPYIFIRGDDVDNDHYSLDKFIKISTLISSRAFEVDAYHENALVPFADIFNHRGDNEHVHFETEFEVCDACGVLDYCEHQYIDFLTGQDDDEKDEVDENDEEAIEGTDNEEEWEDAEDMEDDEDDEDMELDTELPDLEELENAGVDFYEKEEDDEDDDDKKDTCDMVLDRMVKKGEEVFNTYGDHPNIALLSKYGFCYDDNKNDYVSVGENALVDCCLAISAELLKDEVEDSSEEDLQKLAVERTRPRWEFFLTNEQVLCPQEGDEEEPKDDFEDDGCQDSCCGGDEDGHEHGHDGHEHEHGEDDEHEHEHDEDGGCCGGEEEEEGKGRPYFINSEGLFEDKIMCLLHIMFIDEDKFATFAEDVQNALDYFEELSKSQGENKSKEMADVKRKVYQTCLALAEFRRLEYLEDGQWKPIKQELKERDEVREACAYLHHLLSSICCRLMKIEENTMH